MEWVTTTDVSAEVWCRILEFANTDIAQEAIIKRHGPITSNRIKDNYKKQAMQIRVAILQAREYFDSAAISSLITSPNHLYYGMICLASATMLLRGNGEMSLDRLREDSKNKHHGLDFSTTISSSSCKTGLAILNRSYVKVLKNGHFMNWYNTLPDIEEVYAITHNEEENGILTTRDCVGKEVMMKPDDLVNQKRDILELIIGLPDMFGDLKRYGISTTGSRISFEISIKKKREFSYNWIIHNAGTASELQKILESFKSRPGYESCWSCPDYENSSSCVVKYKSDNINVPFQWPAIREDINNEQIVYASQLHTHEIVDSYLVGYALSMLSRYYPDYWISCLESHCKSATVIERLVLIMIKKFPVMALNLLRSENVVISAHKPPWH